ncbi:MAG: adenylate/guanylate cyclase domain-containing protein [Kiloniellales bacterium]|nr:adenylate/guanylate cyclase domain-containing protein [Kiloniellales bacterium]
MEPNEERRLTTILSADVVGYSRLMAVDEAGTHAQLKAHRKELLDPKTAEYHGRTVKLTGDGALMEFASVVEAVGFAVDVQRAMVERNAAVPEDRRIDFRIGINIGDIIVDEDDIYGNDVNVTVRLEGLAEPGGICISGKVYDEVRNKLPLGLEDLGEQEVKNIPEPVRAYRVLLDPAAASGAVAPKRPGRRPWRWAAAAAVAAVLAGAGGLWWQPWAPAVEPASVTRMAFPLPDKPSVAVLPFDNLGGDAEQDLFVDALTENIITELSRFSDLFVIARNSVFTYKGKPVKVQQVAEDLGVRYVLEGSVQGSADRIRITAQLVDALTGKHLWAERYDRDRSDIFAVQDEVTQAIVARLGGNEGELAEAATKLARRKPTSDLGAYESYLLGVQHKHRYTREDTLLAHEFLNRAIELDPKFARPYVALAWTHFQEYLFGWSDAPARSLEQALEAARTAVALDASDAEAHWAVAEAHIYRGEHERTRAEYDKALALNPNNADILANWGLNLAYLGIDAQEGVRLIRKAMRLNPHHPEWYDRVLGNAAFTARSYEEAISAIRNVNHHTPDSRAVLAASYAQLGRLEEARVEVKETLKLVPDATVDSLSSRKPFVNTVDMNHYREALRKAGLPE